MINKEEVFIFVRYGMVGVLNTAVFGFFVFLFKSFGLHYSIYTAIGYTISILFSYTMNSLFTFKNKLQYSVLFRFIFVTVVLLICVQGIQFALIDILSFKELYGILAGMVFYTGIGFLINRFFVFK